MSCNRTIYNANSVLNARMSDGRMFTMYRPSGLADDQTFFKENLSDDTTALNNVDNIRIEKYIKKLQGMNTNDLREKITRYPNYDREDSCNNCPFIYTVPLSSRQNCTTNGCTFEKNPKNESIGLGRTNNDNLFNKKYKNTDSPNPCDPCDTILLEDWKRGVKIQPDMEYSETPYEPPDFRFGTKITGQADVLRRLQQQRNNRSNESNVWGAQTLSSKDCANIPRYEVVSIKPYEGGTYATTDKQYLKDNWDDDYGVCRNSGIPGPTPQVPTPSVGNIYNNWRNEYRSQLR